MIEHSLAVPTVFFYGGSTVVYTQWLSL